MVQEGQGVEKGLWNFPLGRLENNEKILNAAIRVLKKKQAININIWLIRNI
jgi:ADP-ribose pyrophosphatase YjhB (NUDIX family)